MEDATTLSRRITRETWTNILGRTEIQTRDTDIRVARDRMDNVIRILGIQFRI